MIISLHTCSTFPIVSACVYVCSVSWTDCGAPYGKILMIAVLDKSMYDAARQQCHNDHADLATVHSALEVKCANTALSKVRTCPVPRNGQPACQRTRVSGTGLCNCGAWVGLTGSSFSNRQFHNWTWYTPSSNTTTGSIVWRSGYPNHDSSKYRVNYNPSKGGFGNVPDYTRPYLCQQYYPPGEVHNIIV